MGQQKTEVTEYNCERCEYKWIARRNGKDKDKPNHCPKCKTWMWNMPRQKNMSVYYDRKDLDYSRKALRDYMRSH
jgi:DNA-directed RNA polymerase subunit RPC12/RpoP